MESTLPVCHFILPLLHNYIYQCDSNQPIATAAASHKVKETAEDLSNSGVADQVEGQAAHARGKAEELKGRASGKMSEMSGKAQEMKGKVKGAAAETKGKAKESVEEMQSNLFE